MSVAQSPASQRGQQLGFTLLSGEGGSHDGGEPLRRHAAFVELTDGRFFILVARDGQPVRDLRQRLRDEEVEFDELKIEIHELATLNSGETELPRSVVITMAEQVIGGHKKAVVEDKPDGAGLLGRLRALASEAQTRESTRASDLSVRMGQTRQREFAALVSYAARAGASDMHMQVLPEGTTVAMRVHGRLFQLEQRPADIGFALCQTAYAMSDIADAAYDPRAPQGTRLMPSRSVIAEEFPPDLLLLRLQFNPLEGGGRKMVARLLYRAKKEEATNIGGLGYMESQLSAMAGLRLLASGLVVFAGPVGSGKSTTMQRNLARLIRESRGSRLVATIEDPVEYPIPGADQMAVRNAPTEEERRAAFHGYLRALLRSDPDVIMIQEIRDEAVARIAFEAANVGRAVWSTVHANSAISVFARLGDWIDTRYLFDPDLMRGVVVQRLLGRLCEHCKVSLDDLMQAEQGGETGEMLERQIARYTEAELPFDQVRFRSAGCEHCFNGLGGRALVAEIMMPDVRLMGLLGKAQETPHPYLEQALNYWRDELEGSSMSDHAMTHVLNGVVDPRDAEQQIGVFIGGTRIPGAGKKAAAAAPAAPPPEAPAEEDAGGLY